MKKFNYLLLGAAGLMLASCSQEPMAPVNYEGGNLQVTVSLPDNLSTRSFGNGETAIVLNYAVFDAKDNTPVLADTKNFTDGNLTTTVTLNLVPSKTYNIVFFAQSEASENTAAEGQESNSVYDFDTQSGLLTVNYKNMTAANNNDDDYDCFYAMKTYAITSTTTSGTAELYRPVAQINWGASDADLASVVNTFGEGLAYVETQLTVKQAYTSLNLLTGEYGTPADVTLPAILPGEGEKFPADVTYTNSAGQSVPYTYVAMNYVLAPKGGDTFTLNLQITNTNGQEGDAEVNVPVSNAPLQANYQTNIYGSLFTMPFDITVTKKPGWGENNPNDIELGISEPPYDADTQTYTVTTLPQLNWVAQQVNEKGVSFDGQTIKLGNNITMAGNWNPIGNSTNSFKGTFDGQGYTLSNLNVNGTENVGFIGSLSSGSKSTQSNPNGVINLNFDGANIVGNHWGGVIVAYTYTNYVCIKDCKVTNSSVTLSAEQTSTRATATWDNGDKAAIIIGFVGGNGITITGNTVTDCSVTAYRDLAGIIGANGEGTQTVTGNTVNGLTLTIDNLHNYKNYQVAEGENTFEQYAAWHPGEILGLNDGGTVVTDNTPENVTLKVEAIATTIEGLQDAAASGGDVELGESITAQGTVGNGYGQYKGGLNLKGGTLNGNGNTLTVNGANSTWDCAINTTGGTIENLTVRGAFRSVMGNALQQDLIIKNCNLGGTYSININDPGKEKYNLIVSGSDLYNWVSYGTALNSASFTKCNFIKDYYGVLGAFVNTTLEECTFSKGWNMALTGRLVENQKITMIDCTVDGNILTAENIREYMTIGLPAWAQEITDCFIFENTETSE